MRPCSRVGLDVTWTCNWKCKHCFYLRHKNEERSGDVPFEENRKKLDQAKAGGLDHAVLVGYGEPSLAKETPRVLEYAKSLGMATSMITNAATGLHRFEKFFEEGLDHLHISSHGLGDVFDKIVGIPGAFQKQLEVKHWLRKNKLPFRTNATLQKGLYPQLPKLAQHEIDLGVYHFVFLGFLPHYEWRDHVREVAVHPRDLRPYIELAADKLIEAGTLFTIRYHPFCHLSPEYWQYVVNARYVAFDPWEWNYDLQLHDLPRLWRFSQQTGNQVACSEPCRRCLAFEHCGGWNRVYAGAFDGAELRPIEVIPESYRSVWGDIGGVHDINPANQLTGTIR